MSTEMPTVNGPLIVKALGKPFLPGRRVFALYEDHVVTAIVRGPQDFPDAIYEPDGHHAWRTLARTRRVSVLSLADVDWIKSYEGNNYDFGASVRLTFLHQNKKMSVLLPEQEGKHALVYLAENFADKLDPKVESTIDARRKQVWILITLCVMTNGWLGWAIWELWTTSSLSGPKLLVGIIWAIYEARGFATTAGVCLLGAVFFDVMMFTFSLIRPPNEPRALNCSNCGYQLRGLQGAECPECGTTIKSSVTSKI